MYDCLRDAAVLNYQFLGTTRTPFFVQSNGTGNHFDYGYNASLMRTRASASRFCNVATGVPITAAASR